jgi:hypothetical protein
MPHQGNGAAPARRSHTDDEHYVLHPGLAGKWLTTKEICKKRLTAFPMKFKRFGKLPPASRDAGSLGWRSTAMADTLLVPAAPSAAPSSQFVDEKILAEVLDLGVGTLRTWRRLGLGPPWYKFGAGPRASVRYDLPEAVAWAKDHRARAPE